MRMIQLDYRDSRPIYSQIVDGFRSQISAGILQNGDRLPSVRELAQQLTINPNTIQRSYRELEKDGWVQSEPGKGSFVRARQQNPDDRLWQTLDDTVRALRDRGITTEELIRHITGGADHA